MPSSQSVDQTIFSGVEEGMRARERKVRRASGHLEGIGEVIQSFFSSSTSTRFLGTIYLAIMIHDQASSTYKRAPHINYRGHGINIHISKIWQKEHPEWKRKPPLDKNSLCYHSTHTMSLAGR
jgi:hypothetical protein